MSVNYVSGSLESVLGCLYVWGTLDSVWGTKTNEKKRQNLSHLHYFLSVTLDGPKIAIWPQFSVGVVGYITPSRVFGLRGLVWI